MQKEWKWVRCLPWYIRQRLCGRLQVRRKEAVAAFAAAVFMLLCFWGVFYPELAFPADVCRRADGSAPEAEDYEKIIFSAGKIGYQVEITLEDLKKVIHFQVAEVAE